MLELFCDLPILFRNGFTDKGNAKRKTCMRLSNTIYEIKNGFKWDFDAQFIGEMNYETKEEGL